MASGAAQTVLQGLRWWAQGDLSDQAAVELLARSIGGRYLRPGSVWVRRCRRPGWYWLDADALADYAAPRAADDREVPRCGLAGLSRTWRHTWGMDARFANPASHLGIGPQWIPSTR